LIETTRAAFFSRRGSAGVALCRVPLMASFQICAAVTSSSGRACEYTVAVTWTLA